MPKSRYLNILCLKHRLSNETINVDVRCEGSRDVSTRHQINVVRLFLNSIVYTFCCDALMNHCNATHFSRKKQLFQEPKIQLGWKNPQSFLTQNFIWSDLETVPKGDYRLIEIERFKQKHRGRNELKSNKQKDMGSGNYNLKKLLLHSRVTRFKLILIQIKAKSSSMTILILVIMHHFLQTLVNCFTALTSFVNSKLSEHPTRWGHLVNSFQCFTF